MALYAQQITGTVKDDQGATLNASTVTLLKATDSSVIKLAVTKNDGQFVFNGLDQGGYRISITHVGYGRLVSEVFQFTGTDVNLGALTLTKNSANLSNVTVTATRPLVEVKADKMILNVEGTINAVGTDALELLRKSPGVSVDRDDNISLSGKNGVQIFIDGRKTPLSGKDLSDYLKTLQSAQIDALEIITNPSAKYEAAGNAGIINIRLKKNRSYGTNGSVNAGWNIGIRPKYNTGVSLNNRSANLNVFGTYNYGRNNNQGNMAFYRTVLDTLFDQKSVTRFRGSHHNFKVGADYFLNPRSTIGVIFNGTIADIQFANSSRTPISYIPTQQVSRLLVANNTNEMDRNSSNFNINYRYAEPSGKEFNLDADYGAFRINSDQIQPNFYFDPTGQTERNRLVYNMIAPSDIDITSIKGDYEQNFAKGKLGIGGKVSIITTDNDFQRYNVFTSEKSLDTLRSNRFDYKENINAGYINYNRGFKGFMIQAGVRVENTTSEGRSGGFKQVGSQYTTYDSSFKRPYTDVFPSAAITFNKNPKSQFSLTYSRRIDRPAYQDLNPFEFKLDEYSFMKGNTQLRPQYTNSFGITHTYRFKLNTTLNYSHVQDVFTQLVDTVERSKSFLSKRNLATQDITSLNISYPFQYKKFSSFVNLNTYYSHYQANFGTGRTVDLDVFAYNVFARNSLKIGKDWTAELSGFYNSPSIWQGTFKTNAMWSVETGVQKQFFKGKGNIKASVSDIFNSMGWKANSDFAGQVLRGSGNWESRQFKLNLSYRFGNNQVKAARQRKTGLDEEAKRAQQSQGIGQ